MSNIPENLRYAVSHEWISVEGEVGTVGITDHAQQELSDVVYVDLPKIGAHLTAGSTVAVIESVKAASDIFTPLSGRIVDVNPEASNYPSLVNSDPMGGGWLFRIELSDPTELAQLLDEQAYQKIAQ